MTTPATVSPEIRTFCESLVSGSDAVYVEYVQYENALPNDCFDNVSRLAQKRGGRMLLGWTIWEWETVLLEAEWHAVWEDQEGGLHDATPKADGETRVLFVPDRDAVDHGSVTPSRHQPLREWEEIAEYIEMCRHISEFQREHYPNLPALQWDTLLRQKEAQAAGIRRRVDSEVRRETGLSVLLSGLRMSEQEAQQRSADSRIDVEARTAHARLLASQGQFKTAFDLLLESSSENRQIANQLGDTFRLLFSICDDSDLVSATRREWSWRLH